MSVGPPPWRARSAAIFTAAYTAKMSLPSTRTPSKPYANAFSARVALALCFYQGREMDQWLFCA